MKNKKEISQLLQLIANGVGKRITKKDGSLDIASFNKQPVIKKIVEQLKSLGIKNSEHLCRLGFVAAGMVLRIK